MRVTHENYQRELIFYILGSGQTLASAELSRLHLGEFCLWWMPLSPCPGSRTTFTAPATLCARAHSSGSKARPLLKLGCKACGLAPLGRSGLTCQMKGSERSPLAHSPEKPLKKNPLGLVPVFPLARVAVPLSSMAPPGPVWAQLGKGQLGGERPSGRAVWPAAWPGWVCMPYHAVPCHAVREGCCWAAATGQLWELFGVPREPELLSCSERLAARLCLPRAVPLIPLQQLQPFLGFFGVSLPMLSCASASTPAQLSTHCPHSPTSPCSCLALPTPLWALFLLLCPRGAEPFPPSRVGLAGPAPSLPDSPVVIYRCRLREPHSPQAKLRVCLI